MIQLLTHIHSGSVADAVFNIANDPNAISILNSFRQSSGICAADVSGVTIQGIVTVSGCDSVAGNGNVVGQIVAVLVSVGFLVHKVNVCNITSLIKRNMEQFFGVGSQQLNDAFIGGINRALSAVHDHIHQILFINGVISVAVSGNEQMRATCTHRHSIFHINTVNDVVSVVDVIGVVKVNGALHILGQGFNGVGSVGIVASFAATHQDLGVSGDGKLAAVLELTFVGGQSFVIGNTNVLRAIVRNTFQLH